MTETPAAQKRGSSLGAGNLPGEFRREGPVDGRAMRAHLLEQPAAQHRHPPAAARRAARIGPAPRLEREAAGRARRLAPGIRPRAPPSPRRSALQASNQAARAGAARPAMARVGLPLIRPRTRATRRSTWAIGVSGRMPWPRLKTCARPAKPAARARSPSSSARPPASSASGSRLPCSASRRGQRRGGARGLDRGVEADRREPVDVGELAELGRRAARKGDDRRRRAPSRATLATMRAIGATHQRSNSAGGSTPAQESKICTASAPAAIWRAR